MNFKPKWDRCAEEPPEGMIYIPNDFYIELPEMSGSEIKVLCVYMRRAYAYPPQSTDISLSVLMTITGLSRNSVIEGRRLAILHGYLIKEVSSETINIISEDLRWQVFERDNFTCQSCGSRRRLTIDHKEPQKYGVNNDIENLQTLCRSCNSKKGARLL